MQHIIIIGYFFINTISRQRLSSGQTSLIVFIIIIIFFLPSCSLGEIFICLLRERESNVLWLLLILENFTNQKNIQQKYKHRIWKKKKQYTQKAKQNTWNTNNTQNAFFEHSNNQQIQHTQSLWKQRRRRQGSIKATTTTTSSHHNNFGECRHDQKLTRESKTNNNNTSIHPKNNNDMTWMSWGKILENTTTK